MTSSYELVYPSAEIDKVGRVQVTRHGDPLSMPGTCVMCGVDLAPDRPFVDFGYELEYHGRLYFCMICLDEVVRPLGYIKEDDLFVTKLVDKISELMEENDRLVKSLSEENDRDDRIVNSVVSKLGTQLSLDSDISL